MKSISADAFLLPVADEFLSEYVPPSAARLAWLTGFTGSAGSVVVTQEKAYLFTDGRYILQAKNQLDGELFEVINTGETSLATWLAAQHACVLAYDPMLHSGREIAALAERNITLQAIEKNPVDAWWQERPKASMAPVWQYPDVYAGEKAAAKIARITAHIKQLGADGLFIAASENINWLLNIRGGDIACTPVLQCYALLQADGNIVIFADDKKFPLDVLKNFSRVSIQPIDTAAAEISYYKHKKLMMDAANTPTFFIHMAKQHEVHILQHADPIERAKAVKNEDELQAIRQCHLEDGAALANAFSWLNAVLSKGEKVDEMQLDAVLQEKRSERQGFICLSFPAIVGAGAHGAIIHYRVTPESNRNIAKGELLLVDSGGQYMGGTTDVTRTLAIGPVPKQYKTHYTLVLKGHIALARAVFPSGTSGSQLDALARQFLWVAGLDYEHGTGHGVGACLGVHEGPQRIGKRGGDAVLQAGMILSNEPGVYVNDSHGIRIENLVEVVEKNIHGKVMLGFENLTYVPYARELIDVSMLSADELAWVNAYHATVAKRISPLVDEPAKAWLDAACKPL